MLTTDDPETGERLDPVNVRNQILTFLVAGHETSASALSFALYFLATHPDEAAKARAEVGAMWPDGETKPRFEEVAKLRAIRHVLDESLRLWPTAPAYFREAKRDTVLGGRYPIKAGQWVIVVLQQVHRDPSVWGDDAAEFRPDRFHTRPGHGYKPFGTNTRVYRPPVRLSRNDPCARDDSAPLRFRTRSGLRPRRPRAVDLQADEFFGSRSLGGRMWISRRMPSTFARPIPLHGVVLDAEAIAAQPEGGVRIPAGEQVDPERSISESLCRAW